MAKNMITKWLTGTKMGNNRDIIEPTPPVHTPLSILFIVVKEMTQTLATMD